MKKQPKNIKREYERALVFADPHAPEHDVRTVGAVLSYARTQWWDYCVILGDFMDFGCISHHNKNKLRQVEGQRVMLDYDIANMLLDQIRAAVQKKNPACKIALLEGNHDEWVERYMDALPALSGMLDVAKNLRLKERGIEWVRAWSQNKLYNIGNAYFHHGLYINKYHAAKMVDVFGVPIFYGHAHDLQSYSKVFQGDDKTVIGQSLGCLCEYDQRYMKGRPNKWQQAFAEFNVFPDGFFQYAVTPIFKHRFVGRDGKVYGG